MDTQTAQKLIIASIAKEAPRINDFSQGSVAYTLTRGIAGAVSEVYKRLDSLEANYLIGSSSGDYLTNISNSLGYERQLGTKSTGYVLVNNQTVRTAVIPARLVLTEPESGLQLIAETSTNTSINPFLEARIPVTALKATFEANFPAGTELIAGAIPDLNFTVGSYRTSAGKICGDLTGGTNLESDAELRERITRGISNVGFNTDISIENYLLLQGDITTVKVQTIKGGAITVWVGSEAQLTSQRLNELNLLLEDNKPAGVLSEVRQLNYIPIYFKVKVYDSQTSNVDQLRVIKENLDIYVKSLNLNEPLILGQALGYLTSRLNYPLEFLAPTVDQYIEQTGQIFRVGEVEVSYSV